MAAYIIPYIVLVSLSVRNNKKLGFLFLLAVWLFLVIFIGLRYEVGADWVNYKFLVEDADNYTIGLEVVSES